MTIFPGFTYIVIGILVKNKRLIFPVFLSILALTFSVYFSLRTNLLYDSRSADVCVLQNAMLANAVGDEKIVAVYRGVAKEWLKVSEDYRLAARVRGKTLVISGG